LVSVLPKPDFKPIEYRQLCCIRIHNTQGVQCPVVSAKRQERNPRE
jgi:hypothetical protein